MIGIKKQWTYLQERLSQYEKYEWQVYMRNGPYELVKAPEDYPGKKYRGRYVYEHHLIWWQNHGYTVPNEHVVHHKNENKRDNRIENLELKSVSEHAREHVTVGMGTFKCGTCGKECKAKPSHIRFKMKINKTDKMYCSRSCGGRLGRNSSA
jgi:hypothetical protein